MVHVKAGGCPSDKSLHDLIVENPDVYFIIKVRCILSSVGMRSYNCYGGIHSLRFLPPSQHGREALGLLRGADEGENTHNDSEGRPG